jgi:hypothetical protein
LTTAFAESTVFLFRDALGVPFFYFNSAGEFSTSMNIYLEIFGYIGTILIIVSMMMKSIGKLRLFNIAGAIISAIYAIICQTWPVAVLNIVLTLINSYRLTRDLIEHKKEAKLAQKSDADLDTLEEMEGETK